MSYCGIKHQLPTSSRFLIPCLTFSSHKTSILAPVYCSLLQATKTYCCSMLLVSHQGLRYTNSCVLILLQAPLLSSDCVKISVPCCFTNMVELCIAKVSFSDVLSGLPKWGFGLLILNIWKGMELKWLLLQSTRTCRKRCYFLLHIRETMFLYFHHSDKSIQISFSLIFLALYIPLIYNFSGLKYLLYFAFSMAEKNFSIFRLLLSKLSVEAFTIKADFLNQELLIKTTTMENYWSQIEDYGLTPKKERYISFSI